MDPIQRIDSALRRAVQRLSPQDCPGGLAGAVELAVFPAGSRLRPRLVYAVADACRSLEHCDAGLLDAAAVSLEMLHCASLVQDDLRCFDDAAVRRGRPSLHRQVGERLAILASDALIVGAFDVLADPALDTQAAMSLVRCYTRRAGSRGGITAGQAWESEHEVVLSDYHAAKTGSLFGAATEAGAIVAGVPSADWARTGELMGCAYQVADDLRDVLANEQEVHKPVRVDALLGRPNAVHRHGVERALEDLESIVRSVITTLPACAHRERLVELVHREAARFVPAEVARSAA